MCVNYTTLYRYFSPCSINMNQFTDPVRTAQKTQSTSVVKTNQLMLYKQERTLYSQIHKEHVTVLCR
jgi:type IV secretory pathway component VirB8